MTAPPSPDPVIAPLCRDPVDDTKYCAFVGTCNESRQRLQHRHGLRGEDCWVWVQLLDQRPRESVGGPGPSSPEGSGV